ncbi:LysR substrate-binding domain-containing protein [Kribbella sp. NPDC003505]|uniref:LysR family transcriptional regulator n=1 Tax=Kribbella sp. NPDC003505 TaxID=3154448 RepID=UPI0033B06254
MDDLRRLRVLRELRERQTVTATASALHLTPSAISQQLAGLSRHLGFAVTERRGRQLIVTPRALALLKHADSVFAQIERARHELQSWSDDAHETITVGAFATAITGLLPGLLTSVRVSDSDVKVELRQAEPPALFDQLDAGRVDIAIAVSFTGSPTAQDPRYHTVDLGADPLDVALPAGHPRSADDQVNLKSLETEAWITGSPGGCCATIMSTACAAAGFTPYVAHQVDDWQAVAQLVASGHGVALMPRLAQRDLSQRLAVRPVSGEAPRRHLFAATRDGAQSATAIAAVLSRLAEFGSTTTASLGKTRPL